MEGVQFKACSSPGMGLMAATVTLVITAAAMRALQHFKTPFEMGTALAFSATVGLVASSLQKAKKEEKTDEQPLTLPTMKDGELAPQWNSKQCQQFKTLDPSDGTLLREAALSGTIEMVRWGLDKAFTEDPSQYEKAFAGPWPQYNNLALDPDTPILSLHSRSKEARFEPVANLLAEVRKIKADPAGYVLPGHDQALLAKIQAHFKKLHPDDKPKPPELDLRVLLLEAVTNQNYEPIEDLQPTDACAQYLIAVVAYERGLQKEVPMTKARLSAEDNEFVDTVRAIFQARSQANTPEEALSTANPERLCDLLCAALRAGWKEEDSKRLVNHADLLWKNAQSDEAKLNLNLCRGLIAAARDLARDPSANFNFDNPAEGEGAKKQADQGTPVLSQTHGERLQEAIDGRN